MFSYAITLIKNTNPVWISDYEKFIALILKKDPKAEIEYYFEEYRNNADDKLHVHGTIRNKRKISFKNISKATGVRCNFSEHPDAGWHDYITKSKSKETELINRSHQLESEYISQFKYEIPEPYCPHISKSNPLDYDLEEASIFRQLRRTGQRLLGSI